MLIMYKLVYTHYWGDESCSGCNHLCFTYASKEEFLFDIFEKCKNFKWGVIIDRWGSCSNKIELFKDVWLDYWEYERLEHNVYTLEEWFNRNKIN